MARRTSSQPSRARELPTAHSMPLPTSRRLEACGRLRLYAVVDMHAASLRDPCIMHTLATSPSRSLHGRNEHPSTEILHGARLPTDRPLWHRLLRLIARESEHLVEPCGQEAEHLAAVRRGDTHAIERASKRRVEGAPSPARMGTISSACVQTSLENRPIKRSARARGHQLGARLAASGTKFSQGAA
jgi:hypothetical protein